MKDAARLAREGKAEKAVGLAERALTWVPGHPGILAAALELSVRARATTLGERAGRDLRWIGWSREAVDTHLENLRKQVAEEKLSR
jgi:hypothetical protein